MTTATENRVTKRELTRAEAAEQFVAATHELALQKARVAEAAAVLLPFLQSKKASPDGKRRYKGVRLKWSNSSTVLDQDAVKAFLGERLPEFQRRTESKPGLELDT